MRVGLSFITTRRYSIMFWSMLIFIIFGLVSALYIYDLDVRATAIVYHEVTYDYPKVKSGLYVTPKTLEDQVFKLKNAGFSFITYQDILNWKLNRKLIPKKSVMITFDDGYESNYKYAFPILKKYGAKATIFIVPANVGTANHVTWGELKEMHESGVFEIGSHSNNHVIMNELKREEMDYQFTASKDAIVNNLGITPYVFAYPEGRQNKLNIERAKAAGYTVQVTSYPISLTNKTKLENCGRLIASGIMSGDDMVNLIKRSRLLTIIKSLKY